MAVPASISRYFAQSAHDTPYLLIDLNLVEQKYLALQASMPKALHHYAIKANPHPEVLKRLHTLGCRFECASITEIDACMEAGAAARNLLYGNPLKKAKEIAAAYARGVEQYVFDAEMELEKIAVHAPGSKVICRITTDGSGAVSPLSIKFGCPPSKAIEWLLRAKDLGLIPYGISFHTGSQQLEPTSWEAPIRHAAEIFEHLRYKSITTMRVLNVGGGFPVSYRSPAPSIDVFGSAINDYVAQYFTHEPPLVYTEPGRYMVGDAGFILSEVVLLTPSHEDPAYRWVYLDIGRYGGLVEEKIDYPVIANKEGKNAPVILAGQTCDSNDVIYPKCFHYSLPTTLTAGDRVVLAYTGAYTTTYSTTLNGFPTLASYCIA